jgi:hypothetical protein
MHVPPGDARAKNDESAARPKLPDGFEVAEINATAPIHNNASRRMRVGKRKGDQNKS